MVLVIVGATGVGAYTFTRNKQADAILATWLGDNTTITITRTPAGIRQGLLDMRSKAVQSIGAISQMIDIPEIS